MHLFGALVYWRTLIFYTIMSYFGLWRWKSFTATLKGGSHRGGNQPRRDCGGHDHCVYSQRLRLCSLKNQSGLDAQHPFCSSKSRTCSRRPNIFWSGCLFIQPVSTSRLQLRCQRSPGLTRACPISIFGRVGPPGSRKNGHGHRQFQKIG